VGKQLRPQEVETRVTKYKIGFEKLTEFNTQQSLRFLMMANIGVCQRIRNVRRRGGDGCSTFEPSD